MTTERPSYRPGPPGPPHGYQAPAPGYGPFPGFGAPPGYGPLPPAPPAGRIRPGGAWIVLTWVLFAVVTVSALTWGIVGFGSGLSAAVPTRTFSSGETATVHLDPADAPAIYVGMDDAETSAGFGVSYPFASPVDVECVISGDAGGLDLVQPERTVRVTADGVEWHQIFLVRVPRAGTYEVQCESEGVRFGVANDPPLGGLMVSVAIALVAAAVAVVTTIVLVNRRAAARRALSRSTWWAPTIP